MGRQSSRIWYQNKDHKEMVTWDGTRFQYHDKAYIWDGNAFVLVWEKLDGEVFTVCEYITTNNYSADTTSSASDTTLGLNRTSASSQRWGTNEGRALYKIDLLNNFNETKISSISGLVESIGDKMLMWQMSGPPRGRYIAYSYIDIKMNHTYTGTFNLPTDIYTYNWEAELGLNDNKMCMYLECAKGSSIHSPTDCFVFFSVNSSGGAVDCFIDSSNTPVYGEPVKNNPYLILPNVDLPASTTTFNYYEVTPLQVVHSSSVDISGYNISRFDNYSNGEMQKALTGVTSDGYVFWMDMATTPPVFHKVFKPTSAVQYVTIRPDRKQFAYVRAGDIYVYDIKKKKEKKVPLHISRAVNGMQWVSNTVLELQFDPPDSSYTSSHYADYYYIK